jgi:hypothetical protein
MHRCARGRYGSGAVDSQAEASSIVALQYKGLVRCLQGRPTRGFSTMPARLCKRASSGIRCPLAFSLHVLSASAMLAWEYDVALQAAEETFEIANEHGLVFWIAGSKITRGCASAQLHRSAEDPSMAMEGLREWRATSAKLYVPTWSALIAYAALRLDEVETAAALVNDATIFANANHDLVSLPDLERLQGEIALRRGERELGKALSRPRHRNRAAPRHQFVRSAGSGAPRSIAHRGRPS